ncbi:hypothetical protein RLDS_22950 [Sphingobium lactosutens DS20]|uniref:Uncharacterized protein n=1 Tax=Sphingobium lactosutens DS20 TaxID=1331060 RepID=T0INP8_9SPHN|nr:hypothetical protein RLDS_22950 [Sphingobium lactosutens DS20]
MTLAPPVQLAQPVLRVTKVTRATPAMLVLLAPLVRPALLVRKATRETLASEDYRACPVQPAQLVRVVSVAKLVRPAQHLQSPALLVLLGQPARPERRATKVIAAIPA